MHEPHHAQVPVDCSTTWPTQAHWQAVSVTTSRSRLKFGESQPVTAVSEAVQAVTPSRILGLGIGAHCVVCVRWHWYSSSGRLLRGELEHTSTGSSLPSSRSHLQGWALHWHAREGSRLVRSGLRHKNSFWLFLLHVSVCIVF